MRRLRGGGGGGRGPPHPGKLRHHWVPSSTHQRNAIKMAFRWRVDYGPLRILVCPTSHLSLMLNMAQAKIKSKLLDPHPQDNTFRIHAFIHVPYQILTLFALFLFTYVSASFRLLQGSKASLWWFTNIWLERFWCPTP